MGYAHQIFAWWEDKYADILSSHFGEENVKEVSELYEIPEDWKES